MAWSYPRKFQVTEPEIPLAHNYQQRIHSAVNDCVQKRVPRTAGAGNGQGRKHKWKSGDTVAKRFPKLFCNGKTIADLEAIARDWDKS